MPVTRLRRTGTLRPRARGTVVAVLLAAAWLGFLVVLSVHSVSAAPSRPASAHASNTTTPTATPLTNTPTLTPTNTPEKGPPTETPTSSASPTASATTTATLAPTATTTGGGGGGTIGGNPNDPGSASSQATKVVLAQPTYGSGGDSAGQGISVASFASNGLLFASLMSCIVGLLGIVVAVIAVRILRRDGYGPFLRALLLGKRASQQPRVNGAVAASGAANVRRAAWSTDDVDDLSGPVRRPPTGPRTPNGPRSPRPRGERPDW